MRPSVRTAVGIAVLLLASTACSPTTSDTTTSTTVSTTQPTTTSSPTAEPPVVVRAEAVTEPAAYELLEFEVDIVADYSNPFDQRDVALDATFVGPDGSGTTVPGFWDADDSWRIRFTPDTPGTWTYTIAVTDTAGTSEPFEGSVAVAESDQIGRAHV